MFSGKFTRTRPGGQSTPPPVVADAIYRKVVHHRAAIDVGDVNHVDVGHCPVIKEGAAPPFASDKAHTDVAEPIIDPAIEADVGAPVTACQLKAAPPSPNNRESIRDRAAAPIPTYPEPSSIRPPDRTPSIRASTYSPAVDKPVVCRQAAAEDQC